MWRYVVLCNVMLSNQIDVHFEQCRVASAIYGCFRRHSQRWISTLVAACLIPFTVGLSGSMMHCGGLS